MRLKWSKFGRLSGAFLAVTLTFFACLARPADAAPAGNLGFDLGAAAGIIADLIEIKNQCSAANLNKLLDEMLANSGSVTIALQWILAEIDRQLQNPDLSDDEREELIEIRASICEFLHDLINGTGEPPDVPEELIDNLIKFCNLTPKELEDLRRKLDKIVARWKFGAEFLYNMYCVDTAPGGGY